MPKETIWTKLDLVGAAKQMLWILIAAGVVGFILALAGFSAFSAFVLPFTIEIWMPIIGLYIVLVVSNFLEAHSPKWLQRKK